MHWPQRPNAQCPHSGFSSENSVSLLVTALFRIRSDILSTGRWTGIREYLRDLHGVYEDLSLVVLSSRIRSKNSVDILACTIRRNWSLMILGKCSIEEYQSDVYFCRSHAKERMLAKELVSLGSTACS